MSAGRAAPGQRRTQSGRSAGLFLLGVLVWIDDVAGLVLGRPQDDLMAGVAELGEIIAGHALELGKELSGLRPFPVFAIGDLARDGGEFIAVYVVGKLAVIEALGGFDRLRQHLAGGVGERSEPIAQRIDA